MTHEGILIAVNLADTVLQLEGLEDDVKRKEYQRRTSELMWDISNSFSV